MEMKCGQNSEFFPASDISLVSRIMSVAYLKTQINKNLLAEQVLMYEIPPNNTACILQCYCFRASILHVILLLYWHTFLFILILVLQLWKGQMEAKWDCCLRRPHFRGSIHITASQAISLVWSIKACICFSTKLLKSFCQIRDYN